MDPAKFALNCGSTSLFINWVQCVLWVSWWISPRNNYQLTKPMCYQAKVDNMMTPGIQGIQQVCNCIITIQVGNCPIAHKATQMGPRPIHAMTSYVGPMPYIMTFKGEWWAQWSSRVYVACISLKVIVWPNTQLQQCDPGVHINGQRKNWILQSITCKIHQK